MKTVKFAVILITGMFLCGCNGISNPFASTPAKPAAPQAPAGDKFTGTENQPATAVESALILSEKYSKAAEQLVSEQTKNSQLTSENEKLKTDVATLQSQLSQTQKELGEANQLLIDLQKDLNNWKADIIGFRDEMRKAQQSQLEALTRIMLILGADTPSQTADNSEEPAQPAQPAEPNTSKE